MPSIKKALLTLTSALAISGLVAAPALANPNQWRGQGVNNIYKNGFNNNFRNGSNRNFINNRNNRGGRVIVNNFNRGNVGFVGVNRFNNNRFVRGNNFRRNNGLNGTGAAFVGVGAGLLTLALINQSQQNRQPNTVIVQNTQPVNAAPQGNFNQNFANNQFSQCLQTREYQTTVIVGGAPQNAYGTACLQQDGSWLQGPAIATPY